MQRLTDRADRRKMFPRFEPWKRDRWGRPSVIVSGRRPHRLVQVAYRHRPLWLLLKHSRGR
jgi:hypothetical protein